MDDPVDDEADRADVDECRRHLAPITEEERAAIIEQDRRECELEEKRLPSLDDPDLPPPARAALEAVAALESIVPELGAWHETVLARSRFSLRHEVPDAVVAWFRRSFAATMMVIDVNWSGSPCEAHARPTLPPSSAFKVIYLAASATPEYERDDDLRLMLPDVLYDLLHDHGLATTVCCTHCRESIQREIGENCLAHYKSQFRKPR